MPSLMLEPSPGVAADVAEPDAEVVIEAEPSPAVRLDETELDVETQLPDAVATLQVSMVGEQHVRIVCRSGGGHIAPLELNGLERPRIALSDIAREHEQEPSDCLDLMWAWAQNVPELAAWLGDLARSPGFTHLVIIDDSRFEIPWELLRLGCTDVRMRRPYLGEVIAVTRWQARTMAPAPASWLAESDDCSPGTVVAYLSDELHAIERDIQSLKCIEVREYRDADKFKEAELQSGAPGRALIYLACHGVHSDTVVEVALGSQDESSTRLTLGRLNREGIQIRCPVFLNACHSARFFSERLAKGPWLRGFPELFLRGGAPGVIGTVGQVDDEFAATFAKAFILGALAMPDAPIPMLLRDVRAEIVARRESGETDSDLSLVCAFMYVYYGAPQCRLALRARA